jgi:hypothetical protein
MGTTKVADERVYRVGQIYRDTGGVTKPEDQFLRWINTKGAGMGNSEGIRAIRNAHKCMPLPAFLVLVTHELTGGARNPWDDLVDFSAGEIIYWGDAKRDSSKKCDDFKGNANLLAIHTAILEGRRNLAPPILHFSKPKVGFVRFNGLCALDRLERSWFDDHGTPVPNLRATFAILDVEEIGVDWLHCRSQAHSAEEVACSGPAAWRKWTRGVLDRMEVWKSLVRPSKDQLPEKDSEDDLVLAQLTSLAPSTFEAAVVALFQRMPHLVHKIAGTRPTSDGGFDFFGRFRLARPLSYEIDFRGEVKRYARKTSVGAAEVSRLVARLGRGEFGVFVTTSYFSPQAQAEVIKDRYPIKLIAGLDLVNLLKELQLISDGSISPDFLGSLNAGTAHLSQLEGSAEARTN